MSILDRHPAPWKIFGITFPMLVDANGTEIEKDLVPLMFDLSNELAAARAENERLSGRKWTKEPPTKQGEYWHWNGDLDCAPLPYFVMRSGTTNKCFVSCGQLGITRAIDCDEYGGWWCPLEPFPGGWEELLRLRKAGVE